MCMCSIDVNIIKHKKQTKKTEKEQLIFLKPTSLNHQCN